MSTDLTGSIFLGAGAAWVLFRIFKYRGMIGAFAGARVQSTVGEIKGAGGILWRTKLRVHALVYGDPDKAACLEVISHGITNDETSVVTLSTSDARNLAALIQAAIET